MEYIIWFAAFIHFVLMFCFEEFIIPNMPGKFWDTWRLGFANYKKNENRFKWYGLFIGISTGIITSMSDIPLTIALLPMFYLISLTTYAIQICIGYKKAKNATA